MKIKLIQKQSIIISSLLIIIVAIISTSCSKSPKCWGNNKTKGIIESSILIDCEPLTGEENFVIQNDSAYFYTFNDSINEKISCNDLPAIDFSTQSLLGLYATGGCEVKYIREVTSFDNEKKYHYKVTVKSCGACMREVYSFNWITVPKIPEGFIVTFEKENK